MSNIEREDLGTDVLDAVDGELKHVQTKNEFTLTEFQRQFPDKAACFAYLRDIWGPERFRCCQGAKVWWSGTSGKWQCGQCRRSLSVTAGTIFAGNKQIEKWFAAVWLVTSKRNGCTAQGLRDELRLPYATAYDWRKRIRGLLSSWIPARGKVTLEVVKLPFRREHHKHGRQYLVLIAIERTGSRDYWISLGSPADLRPSAVCHVVSSIVMPGSAINTNSWEGFNAVGSPAFDRRCEGRWVSPDLNETLTKIGQTIANDLNSWLKPYYGGINDINPYLREFAFRFNHRLEHDGNLFRVAIEKAVSAGKTPPKNSNA